MDAAAPEGPLVLVGHSMGGMTVMAFADQYPGADPRAGRRGRVRRRRPAGKLAAVTFGLPVGGRERACAGCCPGVLRRWEPGGAGGAGPAGDRRPVRGADQAVLVRSRDVDPAVARFAERLIEATPIDVVAEFYPAFTEHEKATRWPRSTALPGAVLAGDKDLLTPSAHSEAIAERLPDAELVVVPDAGHLVMLEQPETGDRPARRAAGCGRGRRSAPGRADPATVGRHGSTRTTARWPTRRTGHAPAPSPLDVTVGSPDADARAGPPARRRAGARRPGAAHRRAGRGQDHADPRASARASAYAAPSPRRPS